MQRRAALAGGRAPGALGAQKVAVGVAAGVRAGRCACLARRRLTQGWLHAAETTWPHGAPLPLRSASWSLSYAARPASIGRTPAASFLSSASGLPGQVACGSAFWRSGSASPAQDVQPHAALSPGLCTGWMYGGQGVCALQSGEWLCGVPAVSLWRAGLQSRVLAGVGQAGALRPGVCASARPGRLQNGACASTSASTSASNLLGKLLRSQQPWTALGEQALTGGKLFQKGAAFLCL